MTLESHPRWPRKTLKSHSITPLSLKPVSLLVSRLLCLYLSHLSVTAGKLEEALEKYKRSQEFGVERASVHIRNVERFTYIITHTHVFFSQVSAKILGKRMQKVQESDKSEE